MASAKLSAELFTVPLPDGSFIVYAPLRRAAFVANAALVNVLASAQEKGWLENADDASVGEFLRQLEILDGKPECAPSLHLQGEPEPTAVTLFLTTACNLRCTYCYASAGDTPTKFMPLEVAKAESILSLRMPEGRGSIISM